MPKEAPIASRAEFKRLLEETRRDADRLAEKHEGVYQFASVSGLLKSIEMTLEYDQVPKGPVRRQLTFAGDMMFSTGLQPDLEEWRGLAQRASTLMAFWSAWPEDPPDAAPEPEPPAALCFPSLEAFIWEVHQTRADLERAEKTVRESESRGELLERRTLEGIRYGNQSLSHMIRGVAEWITGGDEPTGERRSKAAIRPAAVRDLAADADPIVQDLGHRLGRLDSYFRAWPPPAAQLDPNAALGTLEDFIRAIHKGLVMAAGLERPERDEEFSRAIDGPLKSIVNRVKDWVDELRPPTAKDRSGATVGSLAQDRLSLFGFDNFATFATQVQWLIGSFEQWPPAVMPQFLTTLYETSIDTKLLLTQSGDTGLPDVDGLLDRLIYRTANGRDFAEHERNDSELATWVRLARKALGPYALPGMKDYVKLLQGIETFFARWRPPSEAQPAPDATKEEFYDEPAAPETISGKIKKKNAAVLRSAEGVERNYFFHLLESAIRTFSSDRSFHPLQRAIGLQLRAIRRWTAAGRTPTAEERQVSLSVFIATARAILDAEERSRSSMQLEEAHLVQACFQDWKPDESDATRRETAAAEPTGMIASPDAFKVMLSETITDAECAVAISPQAEQLPRIVRQLRRMQQVAEYGRALTAGERDQIDTMLAGLEFPPGLRFASVPDFTQDFLPRVRLLNDYFHGRRISSRAIFFDLLRKTRDEATKLAGDGFGWGQDKPITEAIERQLRAIQRWTAGGRAPTAPEQAGTSQVLGAVHTLKGIDKLQEFARRVDDLKGAFEKWPPPGTDPTPEAPPAESEDAHAGIPSKEAFEKLLAGLVLDAQSLRKHADQNDDEPGTKRWLAVASSLGKMVDFLKPTKKRTERQRLDLIAVLADAPASGPNPFPEVLDFWEDFRARLDQASAYFQWLMARPPYAESESRAVESTGIDQVILGSERRLAFARIAGASPGIFVCRLEQTFATAATGDMEVRLTNYLPNTDGMLQVAPCDGWRPTAMRFSPHGEWLAYVVQAPGAAPAVGWCNSRDPAVPVTRPGAAFAWTSKGDVLIIADPAGKAILRVDPQNNEVKTIAPLEDDGDPAHPPRVLVPANGSQLIFTCRREAEDCHEIWEIVYQGRKPVARRAKQLPGAAQNLLIFPDPSGGTLGCFLVDAVRRRTRMIALALHDGKEEVLHEGDSADVPRAPSWTPGGRWIAFYQARPGTAWKPGDPAQLTLLDCDERKLVPLLDWGPVLGSPRFWGESVLLEGDAIARDIAPQGLSHRRVEPEHF